MEYFDSGMLFFCGQSPYIRNIYFFLFEMIHQRHTISYISFFKVFLDQHMEEVFLSFISKGTIQESSGGTR